MTVSAVIYTFLLCYIMFFGGVRGIGWIVEPNFIPFKTIGMYLKAIGDGSMNLDIPIRNLGANLLMFLPLGIFLPYFKKQIDTMRNIIITSSIIIVLLESIQFLSKRGSFDIDDLILNLLGVMLGYIVWRIINIKVIEVSN